MHVITDDATLTILYSVDQQFDIHDIPYDVLWLDIEHTDGKKYFTWDSTRFSHPIEMQDNLAKSGRKVCPNIMWLSCDCHVTDGDYH